MEAVPVLLASATAVAVIVTLVGRPAAIVGGVYVPWVGSAVAMVPPLAVVTAHVTPLLPESLARTAVKVAVAFVQPAFWGKILDELPVTLVIETGGELLPQAMRNPASTSIRHIPVTVAPLDILRRAKPTKTMPASGNVNGSHGERLSALRCWGVTTPEFGPLVLMVRVSLVALEPARIGFVLKLQVTVASGRPLQARVTLAANVAAPPVGVTVKVEVADCPESAVAGVVGVDMLKVGTVTVRDSATEWVS
jgi:hypothetical protein